jgi:Putative zinc-finger
MLNYPFRRSCKEVAALVVAREDRHLDMAEKLALRTHMFICKACPDFENQILTMRNAMRQWRNYAGDGGAATAASKSADASADKAAK